MDFTDEYGLPADGPPDETDIAGQIAAAEAAKAAAEKNLADLQRKHGAATALPAGSGSPAPASAGGPPAGLYERLQDRSVDWPTLQSELAAAGFADARPAGRQPGMKRLSARGVV